jgi:trehalose/maltose hydrolase-like predicted phosphorylase
MTISAKEDKFFSLKNILKVEYPYHYNESKYLDQLRMREIPLFTVSAWTPSKRYLSATTVSFSFQDEKPHLVYSDDDKQQPYLGFEKMLRKGESITFYMIGSMGTTETYSDPVSETTRLNIYTYLTGPGKVIRQHKETWTGFWNKTDIIIEGDAEMTKDVQQMMFFINSFVAPGTAYSSACMGLGNDFWGYKILWDADFWIYPALLLINPDAARSMLEYRWKRLDQAKPNALAHGYSGAMFPWESGMTGEEQTSLLYLTGPFQQHITSDVGLAFWRYFCVTQDKKWLQERGYPLLKEVGDFWLSRVEKTDDGYEITGIWWITFHRKWSGSKSPLPA